MLEGWLLFAVGSDKVYFSIVSTGFAGRAGVFGFSRKHSFHFSRPSALLTVRNANS